MKVDVDKIVGVRPAAEAAGTARSTLITAWRDGLVRPLQRTRGAKLVEAFSLQEASQLGEALRNRVSASALAFQLGLPLYGIEQMLCLELLTAQGPRLSTDWDRDFMTGLEVSKFLEKIKAAEQKAAAEIPVDDPVQLLRVLRAMPGRKPWGPVVDGLLNGIRFKIDAGETPLFQRIFIDRTETRLIRDLRFPHQEWQSRLSDEAVLGDALEMLNLGWKHSGVVYSKPVSGSMPKRVAMDDIIELSRKFVSTAELMARTELTYGDVERRLRKAGLNPPFPGCWNRTKAEREFGQAGLMRAF